jgi:mannose-6-phosphate isomerase-like protein (cupin superfamily)
VQLFRFDEEIAIPISEHGSRFRIGPLTGDGADVRVQVMHVPPGGRIGRHRTHGHQLFAVVAGRGRVSGHDGESRDIGSGYAALWEPGEDHDVASDDGLTAVCIEGTFDVWAMGVTRDIVVSDYDSAWPDWFDAVCAHVWPAVEDVALRVDHVGSTAVPGLAAKPIIDMDVVVASAGDVPRAIERLATVGYRWRGDLGVPGRGPWRPPATTAWHRTTCTSSSRTTRPTSTTGCCATSCDPTRPHASATPPSSGATPR